MEDAGRDIVTIPLDRLLPTVMGMRSDGWRLAQICSAFVEGQYELSYSFARNYELINYRVITQKEQLVPSITAVYKSAFLYENEMKELFGVPMEYIGLDYKNRLYRIDEEAPFIKKEDK